MSISKQVRYRVRKAFNFCCAYCGVSENQIGAELDVDHFQPTSRGGTDDFDNLICTCTACNRFKGYYWPSPDAPESVHLLHPHKDNWKEHIEETAEGQLVGLTSRGRFHVGLLHLNRPQLVAVRQRWRRDELAQQIVAQHSLRVKALRQRLQDSEEEVFELLEWIARLFEGNE